LGLFPFLWDNIPRVKLKTLLSLVFVSVGVLLILLLANAFISREKTAELTEAELQKYQS
jgi:hypothetical protein